MDRGYLCQGETNGCSDSYEVPTPEELSEEEDLLDNDDEELPEDEDEKKRNDEDDEDYDEDKLTEESYRTTFDTNPEELDIQADEVGDDDDF